MAFNGSSSNSTARPQATFTGLYTTSFEGNRIKFGVLLALQLASLPCFLYVLYRFIRNKRLRTGIHHHAVLLLLIVSFVFVTISVSFTLVYMYTSRVLRGTNAFCTFWNWLHYSLNIINLFLMAFASLERNWVIFHPRLLSTKRARFLCHYCPLIFCVAYPPSFFLAAMYIHRCTAYYDYTQLLCKWPCYYYNKYWTNVDTWFNNYVPLFAIPLFCGILYCRILFQMKKLRRQRPRWRRARRLVVQLWALSTLYLAMYMPVQIAGLINLYWLPTFLLQAQIDYMYLFPYLIHLLYPYIVLISSYREIVKQNSTLVRIHPAGNRPRVVAS